MKLSIITINLNNARGLSRTIDSVVNQTFYDFEYIIIDGGSTDNSVEIIKAFSDKITYWVSEPDKGIYNAMNKGISRSSGEYLQFLNSGDWLVNDDVLKRVFNHFIDADIIYGDLINFDENESKYADIQFPGKLTFDFFLRSSIPHPSSFIKRNLFKKCGLYNENLKIVSDWEFFLVSLFKYNSTYAHLDIPVSVFNLNGFSEMPQNHSLLALEQSITLHKHFASFLPDYEELNRLRKELALMSGTFSFRLKYRIIKNRYTRYIFKKLSE